MNLITVCNHIFVLLVSLIQVSITFTRYYELAVGVVKKENAFFVEFENFQFKKMTRKLYFLFTHETSEAK
jgi:hypothetical protein